MSLNTDTKTLVLLQLAVTSTPISPHRPGSFVVGYVDGDQMDADNYLNECKTTKRNALIQNAFLAQIGIDFVPTPVRDDQGQPVLDADGNPKTNPLHVEIAHGFAMMPLSNMDATTGCDWSAEASVWVFPKGSMIQDIEAQMAAIRNSLLQARSTLHTPTSGLA